jgi:hypothetical protein
MHMDAARSAAALSAAASLRALADALRVECVGRGWADQEALEAYATLFDEAARHVEVGTFDALSDAGALLTCVPSSLGVLRVAPETVAAAKAEVDWLYEACEEPRPNWGDLFKAHEDIVATLKAMAVGQ